MMMRIVGLIGSAKMRRLPVVLVLRNRPVLFSMIYSSSRVYAATSTGNSPSSPETKDDIGVPASTHYVPKAERGSRSVYNLDKMVGETRLYRDSRICPTRELYFTNLQWGRHKSTNRKIRHMINLFRAAPFQRLLFPDLFGIAAVTGCLTYYNEVIVAASDHAYTVISLSPTAFAGTTTAIGLLAGFRLNASYGRYREGRGYWSKINTATRDLTRQTLTFMANDGGARILNQDQIRMLRLCQAFPVALNFHLSDKGSHHSMKRRSKKDEAPFEDRVQAEFRAELLDVYDQKTDTTQYDNNTSELLQNDFERLCWVKSQGGNAPLEVLTCMGETIAAFDSKGFKPIYIRELDNQVQILCEALGSCERIAKTPLPTGFSRHSSRLLFMWSNSLPFALYPLMGPIATLPTALLTAYAVLGIEDISVQLEEPFDILPMRQYGDGMFDSIRAIEQGYHRPSSSYASSRKG